MINQEQAEKIREKLLEQIENLPEDQKGQADQLREQILNATPEELEQFSSKTNVAPIDNCIFCKIASGEIKTFKVYESNNLIAFLDINPVSKGHTQILPKKHFQFLFQIPDDLIFKLFMIIKKISPILINSLNAKGLTCLFHQGKDQTVQHLSISLIPRYQDDTLSFEQNRQKGNEKELLAYSQEISKKINRDIEEAKEKVKKEEQTTQKKQQDEKKEISFFKKRFPR